MLQLLLERGQSYTDLASLLGVDEAEVRARARAALTELAGTDPDRNVGLTDYLLGQADPIGRADAVRHLKDDPADLGLATEIAQKIRLIAPAAELPRLPGEERRPRPRRARGRAVTPPDWRSPAAQRRPTTRPRAVRPPSRTHGGPRTTLSRRQTQIAVGVGSGVVLVVAIVLGIAGVFSGDDGTPAAATTTGTTTTAGNTDPPGVSAHGDQGRPVGQLRGQVPDPARAAAAARSNPGRLRDPGQEEGGPRGDPAGRRQRTADSLGEGRPRLHRHRQRGHKPAMASFRFRSALEGASKAPAPPPSWFGTPTRRSSR